MCASCNGGQTEAVEDGAGHALDDVASVGDPDWDDNTSDCGGVNNDAQDMESVDNAVEAYWDFDGEPTDAVDNGDPGGNDDASDGRAVNNVNHFEGKPADAVDEGDLDGECNPYGDQVNVN